jgi:hypothetical protein
MGVDNKMFPTLPVVVSPVNISIEPDAFFKVRPVDIWIPPLQPRVLLPVERAKNPGTPEVLEPEVIMIDPP